MSELFEQRNTLTGRKKLGFAVLLGSLSAFGPLSIDMYLPSFPSLTRDLGAGASQVQLTLTAFLLGLCLGQLVAGSVSDSRGRRQPMIVGIALFTAASALCAIAPSVWALIALRFAQGLFGAVGLSISRAVARDLFSGNELARFFAMLMLVFGLAPILAPVVGGQILQYTSWRGVFVVISLAGVALFVAALLFLQETLAPAHRHTGGLRTNARVFKTLITERKFMGYVLSSAFGTATTLTYVAGSPFVMQNVYDLSPQAFSFCFGLNSFGILIANQVSARLVIRYGAARMLTAGVSGLSFGAIAFLLAVLVDAPFAVVMVTLFITISSIGFIGSNATALALNDHGRAAGSASALLGLFQFMVGALLAPLVGIDGSDTALPMALLMATVASTALLVRIFIAGERRHSAHVPSRGMAPEAEVA